jgi:pimeloyl-ACP methyl ester carboxylesterase
MKEKSIEGSKEKTSYLDIGEGSVIVMLHGFLEQKEMWLPIADSLKDSFRCILIDLPGHGNCSVQSHTVGMQLMANVVDEVITAEKIGSCVIIGHSMGGYVALEYVRHFQRKLKGMILLHSHLSSDDPEARMNRDRAIQMIIANKGRFIGSFFPELFHKEERVKYKDDIEKLVHSASKLPLDQITAVIRGMRDRQDAVGLVNGNDLPILFIAGRHDSRIPLNKLVSQSLLPQYAELFILEKSAHMGHIEEFSLVSQKVREFLNKTIQGN